MSQFESRLMFVWKHAQTSYPKYLFGYHIRPDDQELAVGEAPRYIDMSVVLKSPRGVIGNAVRRSRLELGHEPRWYANQWLEMLRELDPSFVSNKEEPTSAQEENPEPAEAENVGSVQPLYQAA